MKEGTMKLWHGIFILTFLIFYGTLGMALLGSWMYQAAKSLLGGHRLPSKPSLRGVRREISPTSWVSIRGLLRH
jgi:hypothetical protein